LRALALPVTTSRFSRFVAATRQKRSSLARAQKFFRLQTVVRLRSLDQRLDGRGGHSTDN
jgi:hypothetical protein